MDRKPSLLAWVQRFVLGGVVVALLAIGAQATGNAAAELVLSDATSWLVNPPTGEAIQINTVTAEITARLEVAEDGNPLGAVQVGPSAVVLDKSTGTLKLVDGVLLETGPETTSGGNPADLELVEGGGQPWLVDTVAGTAAALDPMSLAAQGRSDIPTGATGAAVDAGGHLWLTEPSTGSIVRVDPDSNTSTLPVVSDDHHIAPAITSGTPALVDATAGRVFALDDSGELRDEFCLDNTTVESDAPLLTGGSETDDSSNLVLSVVAELGALVVTDLDDGTCATVNVGRAIQSGETTATYGPPVMSGDYAYVPDLQMGDVVVVDLREMRTLDSLRVVSEGEPFELFVDNGAVVYNNLVGPEWGIIEGNRFMRGESKYDDGSTAEGVITGEGTGEEGSSENTIPDPDLDPDDEESGAEDGGDSGEGEEGTEGDGEAGDDPTDRPGDGGDNADPLDNGEVPADGGDEGGDGPGGGGSNVPTPAPPAADDQGSVPLDQEDINVQANFTYSPPGPYTVGQTVQFNDASVGAPTSWTWNFGDGTTAQGPNVTHAWAGKCNCPVTLTVSSNGIQSEISTLVTVTDPDVAQPPTADFTLSTATPTVGEPVRFTDRSTNDPTSWTWDFGDGTTGQGKEVFHTWSAPGPQDVLLTVGNDQGQDTRRVRIVVVDRVTAPVAQFDIDRTTLKTGEDVRLTDTSTGNPTSVVWRFGDGTVQRSAPGASVSHQWAEPDDYTITLTVSNDAGESTATTAVTVEPAVDPPTVQINGQATTEVDKPLGLTAVTTNNPSRIEWDFDNGTGTNGASASPVWTEPGEYLVTVEVENDAGTATAELLVTVTPKVLPPLDAHFERNPVRPEVGQTVQFTDASSGAIVSWQWDFDDGGTSSAPNPTHVFREARVHVVSLVVTDEQGETDRRRRNIRVQGGDPPEANFQFDPGEPVAGQNVQFTSTSEGNVASYLWQFGDGATSTDPNPVHAFASGNEYRVSLTVADAAGQETTRRRVVRVAAAQRDAPEATFAFSPGAPVAGQPITFEDRTPGPVGTPQWTFPNEVLTSRPGTRTISRSFDTAGQFPVTMEVCWNDDPDNCGQVTRTITVDTPIEAPQAGFEVSGPGAIGGGQIVADRNVRFRSTAVGGGIDRWTWVIDGQSFNGQEVVVSIGGAARPITVVHIVANAAGENRAEQQFQLILREAPTARFSAAPVQAIVGQPVQFTDMSTGTPNQWEWTFGDGSPAVIEQNPVHTYTEPNRYQVTLIAKNQWGDSQPFTQVIEVRAAEPPVSQPVVLLADGTPVPQGSTLTIGTPVLLRNTSTSPNIDYVEWELLPFDLGNVRVAPGQDYATNAFGFPGERTIRSRVVNTSGQASAWVDFTVQLALG